jgi:branched-chain amino acid aminotransferase
MGVRRMWVDGRPHDPELPAVRADDPGLLTGWTVFETLLAHDGEIVALDHHLQRLTASARAACLPSPDAEVVRAELLVAAGAPGLSRLRVTLTAGGARILTAEPVDPARRGGPIRASTGPWRADPWLDGRVKHGSRAGWMVAVRRSGQDEVLLIDDGGWFMEGTTSAILAVVAGEVRVAPDDGRVLESTALASHLESAASLGFRVVRVPAGPADPLDGLYIASATRRLCPVVSLDDRPMPGWEPVGRALAEADDRRWGFPPISR